MRNKNEIANRHASEYIAAVFKEALMNSGFVCPDENLLCWYRIKSTEIVNSIVFCTRFSTLPLFLEINYGIFPTFEMPIHIDGVVCNENPDEELFTYRCIVEDYPNGGTKSPFSETILVNAPTQGGRGLHTFTELILPQMDHIETIQEAYIFHKNRRANHPLVQTNPSASPFGELSKTFISMALWADDKEMYPYAISQINRAVTLYQKLSAKYPRRKNYAQEFSGWKRLQEVFSTGDRDSYLVELSQKMEQNAKALQAYN